ncbi:MAG: hypothetical protein HWE18_12635 [Gammaproteobacteria bacterium]|nr:hypothetical protein [Gammaproteobacteria bacterium]
MLKHGLIALLILFMLEPAYASNKANRNSNYLGPNVEIFANDITQLKLPVKILKGSQIRQDNGITIEFSDMGEITLQSIKSLDFGFPEMDMRDFPLHVMGLKKIKENNEYANIIDSAMKDSSITYHPIKTAQFKTRTGNGYLTIGLKGSFIYLTDVQHPELLTKIHIENMKEADISNIIIKGLL